MESNQSIQQSKQCNAILVSGKLFHDDDDQIWPTKGQFSMPSGRWSDFHGGVNQTTVEIGPHRQTWKAGQIIACY